MRIATRRIAAAGLVVVLAGFNLAIQFRYVAETARPDNGIRLAMERLAALQRLVRGRPVLLDTNDPSFARIVALYTRGHPTTILAGNPTLGVEAFIESLAVRMRDPRTRMLVPYGDRGIPELFDRVLSSLEPQEFPLRAAPGGALSFRQVTLPGVAFDDAVLVAPTSDGSVLNASTPRPDSGRYYVRDLSGVRNHLALIDSPLGQVVFPGVIENVALWQREPDFANPGQGVQAIGRYLLFQVLNPVPGSRLLLDFTTGPLAQLGRPLPPAAVVGQEQREFGLVGHGAARALSAPVAPRVIGGRSFIAIDLGVDATRFVDRRSGLAGLFNRHLSVDPRRFAGFVRNISLLTPQEADAFSPPSGVTRFPVDLFAPGLQFSGVYEDGWIADRARFRLSRPGTSGSVAVRGHVPGGSMSPGGQSISILVDGEPVLRRRLDPGDFDLRVAIPPADGPRWVELQLGAVHRLSVDDGRIASILLRSIELGEGR